MQYGRSSRGSAVFLLLPTSISYRFVVKLAYVNTTSLDTDGAGGLKLVVTSECNFGGVRVMGLGNDQTFRDGCGVCSDVRRRFANLEVPSPQVTPGGQTKKISRRRRGAPNFGNIPKRGNILMVSAVLLGTIRESSAQSPAGIQKGCRSEDQNKIWRLRQRCGFGAEPQRENAPKRRMPAEF